MTTQTPVLLIVEDSPEDFELMRRGLEKVEMDFEVRRCVNGDDALDYLQQTGDYSDAPAPAIVLLDLNLPGTDGREVLEEMRHSRRLAALPTVIFSNSNNINDVNACYALGANTFIEKPLGPQAFARVMAQLCKYWLRLARLPDFKTIV